MKINLKSKRLRNDKLSLYIEYYDGYIIDKNGTKKHRRRFCSLTRLEKLQQEIKTFKIQPDPSGIDYILKGYNDSQKR